MRINLYEEIIDNNRWRVELVEQLDPFTNEPETPRRYDIFLTKEDRIINALTDFLVPAESYQHPSLSWAPLVWTQEVKGTKDSIRSRLKRLNECAKTAPLGVVKEFFNARSVEEEFGDLSTFKNVVADIRGNGAYLCHKSLSGIIRVIFVKSGKVTDLFSTEELEAIFGLYMERQLAKKGVPESDPYGVEGETVAFVQDLQSFTLPQLVAAALTARLAKHPHWPLYENGELANYSEAYEFLRGLKHDLSRFLLYLLYGYALDYVFYKMELPEPR